jgi:hypothetical protein
VFDRDQTFTGRFWQELFSFAKMQLCMSLTYHPELDGQTEGVKQCMETCLCCFVSACPKKWCQWLSLAEYQYNTSFHSSIGRSPFEALYGHCPRHFRISVENVGVVESLDQC